MFEGQDKDAVPLDEVEPDIELVMPTLNPTRINESNSMFVQALEALI